MPEDDPELPTVFLSYSHDSKEHKEWVAKLAVALLDKRIQVLFDQYDLGPGDDVPKFMEHSFKAADRVLMVCTESYVRKANDGKGGVGYEAMIVTGELVRDLGTNKFIPVICQPGSATKSVPTCVGTRLYVDMSEDAGWDEGLATLVEEIHRVRHLKKPPLGPMPLFPAQFEGEAKTKTRARRKAEFLEALSSPEAAYNEAATIISDNNRVMWRKFLLAVTDHGAVKAQEWLTGSNHQMQFREDDPLPLFNDLRPGIDGYAPFMACMVAAAESGEQEYAGQLGWVDTIYSPPNWPSSGSTYTVRLPEAVLFVAQALIGGMLMESGAGKEAYQLATTKVNDKYERSSLPIYLQTGVNGWPDSLAHRCTTAWHFLNTCIEGWNWIKEAFGSADVCRSAVTGYYMLMTFLDFVATLKKGNLPEDTTGNGGHAITTNLCCLSWQDPLVRNGYKIFLRQHDLLDRILKSNGLDRNAVSSAWPRWIKESQFWIANVYRGRWSRVSTPHETLLDDWDRDPFKLD